MLFVSSVAVNVQWNRKQIISFAFTEFFRHMFPEVCAKIYCTAILALVNLLSYSAIVILCS